MFSIISKASRNIYTTSSQLTTIILGSTSNNIILSLLSTFLNTAKTPHRVISALKNRTSEKGIKLNKFEAYNFSTNNGAQAVSGLLHGSPEDFIQHLVAQDITRCCFTQDSKNCQLVSSHTELEGLQEFLNTRDVDNSVHEGIFIEIGRRSQCLLGAFLGRSDRGQACGGIRLQKYGTLEEFLDDGLRMSYSTGVKAALAGMWFSGGQGIVVAPSDKRHLQPDFREKLLHDYGDFLTSLNGCFIGAGDVGIVVNDLNVIRSRSRYVLGISEDKGGSGNPAHATGRGVVCAMEGALDYLGFGDLTGKDVVVQGAGNIGVAVIHELLNKGVHTVTVTECHQNRIDDIRQGFAKLPESSGRLHVLKVGLDDTSALTIPCDILSPCAYGNVVTEENVPLLEARMICGAATNQLESVDVNRLLEERGVTYVVEFVASRMGLVQVCTEMYGRLADDPAIQSHFDKDNENGIFQRSKSILELSSKEGVSSLEAAHRLADTLSRAPHPLHPGRARRIMQSLVGGGWHRNMDYWRKRANYGQ